MAVVGEGPWTNPISGIEETITGVYCSCYDCDNYSFTMDTKFPGSIFMTKLEYKELYDQSMIYVFRSDALYTPV